MTRNYRTTAKQLTASRRVAKHLESAERELERRVRRQRRRSPLDRASRKRKPGRLRRAADQPTPETNCSGIEVCAASATTLAVLAEGPGARISTLAAKFAPCSRSEE